MDYSVTDGSQFGSEFTIIALEKELRTNGKKGQRWAKLKKHDSKSMSVAIMIFIRMTSVMAQSFKKKPPLVMSVRGNRRF